MPRKPSLRKKSKYLWLRQQRKQTNADNLQGAHIDGFSKGRPIIRMANGGKFRHSQSFSRGSIGIGDQVNPTLGAIPKYDFLGETPIEVTSSTLQELA